MASQKMNSNSPNTLDYLVSRLPECYQPIFGNQQYTSHPSRSCDDRFEPIRSIYVSLEAQLGRPLRVLDLGCAQGFFSLSLASLGSKVVGIDFSPENIAVCKKLCEDYPDLEVEFHEGKIEVYIAHISSLQFDLVLGLSVFHHLIHEFGIAVVVDLLCKISQKAFAAVFEFALREEPLYWAESLPTDQRSLLSGFAFVHEVIRLPTHLSEVKRPLYFASNRHWFLNGESGLFDSWTDKSHRLAENAHLGSRRYFFHKNVILKQSLIDSSVQGQLNLREIRNEADFLNRKDLPISVPSLILHGENEAEVWLVREIIEGRVLVDCILDGDDYDPQEIVESVLIQLCSLENAGLFHNDLRPWNVLLKPDGNLQLMDFGSITTKREDNCWPGDLLLNFFIFVREVVTRSCITPVHGRQPYISPLNLPEPFRDIFTSFWIREDRDWTFNALANHLQHHSTQSAERSGLSAQVRWSSAIERRLDEMMRFERELSQLAMSTSNRLMELDLALQSICSSRSWRFTKPLRDIANLVKKLVNR